MTPSATTTARRRFATSKKHRPGCVSHRIIGAGFAAAAVGNAIGTMPQARSFLQWCHDSAWLAPYGWVLDRGTPSTGKLPRKSLVTLRSLALESS
jgi:hypothetical protein